MKNLNSFHVHRIKKRFLNHSRNGDLWMRLKLIAISCIALGFLLTVGLLLMVIPTLPDVDNIEHLVAAQSSRILDRNGEVLYVIHGDENRKNVSFENISLPVSQAVMSIEDDRFYEHMGIDIGAILKAACSEIHLCKRRGGSTITQQYVKNAFLSSERTYSRKLKEILLSLQLERKHSKDEILEMYLNRIPYGSNIFGVEVVAKTFFGKSAADLSIAEAAILASIPKAPTYYSPYGSHRFVQIDLDADEIFDKDIFSETDIVNYSPDFITKGLIGKTYVFEKDNGRREIYVKGRVDFVLSRMSELGYISELEADEALEEANTKEFIPYRENIEAPHFVMYVRELMEEQYGKEQIEKGGLVITTTLDLELQKKAEEAVDFYADMNVDRYDATNASLVALNPDNGHIMVMVGSKDYWNDEIDGKVNVALRPRLPGSSFKPIVYAAAFMQGYAPSTVLYDVKTKFGSWYEPENYDGEFRGPVTMRRALASSLNIPAVKTAYLAGIPHVLDLARKMGINLNQPSDWYGLSLGLGAGEARLIDMVTAYSVFANGGYKIDPVAILKVEDRDGNILDEYKIPKNKSLILDPQVAYLINNVLSDVNARPDPYWQSQLTIPGHINAAKTGTSNKKKEEINYPFDTWTIGYTRRFAGGVWAGNANGDHLGLKASGLDTAGRIWKMFMTEATKEMPQEAFEKPDGIKWFNVSKRSGKLPSNSTPSADVVSEIFASFSIPTEYDNAYQLIEVDKVSGKLATEYTPNEAREEKAYYTHHSIIPDNINWEEAVRLWAVENGQDELPPIEYDDIHTPDNVGAKPQIKIKSPSQNSVVSPPNVGVWVDIESPAGVSKVDYYWADELLYTATTPPFKGVLTLPEDVADDEGYEIKVVVFDELYRSNQSSIIVKVGDDDVHPKVSFSYPKNNKKLISGALISTQVNAFDPNGDILKVEFSLDGDLFDVDRDAPYLASFVVPSSGKHKLSAIAYDHAKNKAESHITFTSNKSDDDLSGMSRILSPRKNASLDMGDGVLVEGYIASDAADQLVSLELLAKKEGGRPVVISSADQIQTSNFTLIWESPTAGRYDLYLKLVLDDGKVRFSERVPVLIR